MHAFKRVTGRSLNPDTRDSERVRALISYGILDTRNEAIFDDVVQMAASLCDTPVALISFIDDSR